VLPLALPAASDDQFQGPTIGEFFPDVILFAGTPFEMNRIMIIRIIVLLAIVIIFSIGTYRMKLVPGRFQGLIEILLGYPRRVGEELLGEKDGKKFLPLLTTIFFLVLGMNITGIVPGMNIAGTSVIGLPIVLAVISYVTFIGAGLKKHPGTFLKNSLVPPGVPVYLAPLIAIIEFISTFVLRPVTLTLRLTMNMVVGHLLLVLFFTATSFFFGLLGNGNPLGLLGAGTLLFGFAFSVFEILVAILQAYVFTLLTAVYTQLALAEEH